MTQVLGRIAPPRHADLIVGLDTGDDAAVWRRPDGPALIATADFFTPIVDDARIWGRIAGANAASDVYAMGGRPLFALNLVAWPREQLPMDLLVEVLEGGAEAAEEGGWVVAGGHTVDGTEPMYGQSLVGEVDPDAILTNAGGQPGQALVLTKPIGTGILATAVKRLAPTDMAEGGAWHDTYTRAIREMIRLNAAAADVAKTAGATAATDITGFGLLGHLLKLAIASDITAEIDVPAVPVIPGVRELLAAGHVPGGTERNLAWVEDHLAPADLDRDVLTLLADAQTSGGLLFACAPRVAEDAVEELRSTGHDAAVVGALAAADDHRLRLRS